MATTGKYGEEILESFVRLQEIFLMNARAVPTYSESVTGALAIKEQILDHFERDESVPYVKLDLDTHLDLDPGGAAPWNGTPLGYRIDYGTISMARGHDTQDIGTTLNIILIFRLYENDGSNHYQGAIWTMDDGKPGPYSRELIGIAEETTEVQWPVVMKQLKAAYNEMRKAFGVQSTDSSKQVAQRNELHNLGLGRFLPSEKAILRQEDNFNPEDISELPAMDADLSMSEERNIADDLTVDILAGINFAEILDDES